MFTKFFNFCVVIFKNNIRFVKNCIIMKKQKKSIAVKIVVIQDIQILKEYNKKFKDELSFIQFVDEIRQEFETCRVRIHFDHMTMEHCSLIYEQFLREHEWNCEEGGEDEDSSNSFVPTQGDC